MGTTIIIYKDNWNLNFWNAEINFYFDGTGFTYKPNPMHEVMAPATFEWRLVNKPPSI